MPNTPGGAPYLSMADAPNLAGATQGLAQYMDSRVQLRFASISERDNSGLIPVEGMTAWIDDLPGGPDKLTRYIGGVWHDPLRTLALYEPATGDTTTTSYVNANPSGQFVAPPSGMVVVHIGANIVNSSSTGRSWFGFKIYLGVSASGTPFQDVLDARAIAHSGNTIDSFGKAVPVAGMTPGSVYSIIAAARVTSGTGSYSDRRLIVVPT